jgi:hypothetical protein
LKKNHLWFKLGHANYWPKVELNTFRPLLPPGPAAAAQSIDTGAHRISSGCTYVASSRGRNCIISPAVLDESSAPNSSVDPDALRTSLQAFVRVRNYSNFPANG